VSGKCVVSVKVEGKEIKGSPFTHNVLAADFFGAEKRFEVLYDAKVDGYSNATFHQMCGQVNGTITLVTLAKFGGYNPDNWSGSSYRSAPGAFLFSLTDGKGSAPQKFALKNEQGQSDFRRIEFRIQFWRLSFLSFFIKINSTTLIFIGDDLELKLDSLSACYSKPSHYNLPSNTTLAGSQDNWVFENVQVFRVTEFITLP